MYNTYELILYIMYCYEIIYLRGLVNIYVIIMCIHYLV